MRTEKVIRERIVHIEAGLKEFSNSDEEAQNVVLVLKDRLRTLKWVLGE